MKKIFCLIISFLLILGSIALSVSADETYQCNDFTYILENGEATIIDCETTKEHLIVPDTLDGFNVTAIGERAFEGLNSIVKVTVGENVKRIGEYAFFDCCNLKTVRIMGDCEEIGKFAFGYTHMRTHEGVRPGMVDWHADTEFYIYTRFYLNGVGYQTLRKFCKDHSFKNFTSVTVSSKIGEVDCDRNVTVKDATAVQKYIAGLDYLNKPQRVNGDINRDKVLDVNDATAIQKTVAGMDIKTDTRRLFIKAPDYWAGSNVHVEAYAKDYLYGEKYMALYDSETGLHYVDVPLIVESVDVISDYIVEVYSNDVDLPRNSNSCLIRYVSNTEYNGLFVTYTFECVEMTD